MITSLSVLIPVYNRDCSQLVRALQRQAMRIEGLQFEILVADDGSSQEELKAANRAVNQWQGCRVVERATNGDAPLFVICWLRKQRGVFVVS